MLHRSFGKICFATISDGTGRMQILFARENCSINVDGKSISILNESSQNGRSLDEEGVPQGVVSGNTTSEETDGGVQKTTFSETLSAYKFAEKLIDLGDFIGVKGELFYTHKGELTLFVKEFTFLTKAIRPLPEKWHGIEDNDERYRKRYLDMATDEELKALFYRKSKFWNTTRNFLLSKGFLEVDTPTLEHTTGGAEARPFATHHNDYDSDVFLRISIGELWQKRLMAGGFPKTFEIGRAYRNEGSSPDHLQEFTNMEFYWAYADYTDGMRLVSEMYRTIAKEVYGKTKFSARGHNFDLADEWYQVDYVSAVREKTGIDILTATDDEMRIKLAELGVKYDGTNRERLTDTLWKYTRKQISGPAFLVDHPALISPLAKPSEKDPSVVERFQVILGGSEIGNGYSELNDPIDQRNRFEKQQEMLSGGDDEAMMPDWEFVEMLEHGMPPTCGFGFGERLFAFLEDKPIREVQYFPFIKQKPDTTHIEGEKSNTIKGEK
ncbi:lysine--tRNA ligase [Candidatus Gracilibacteria bacterium]|nr:lysine--tRNA ligase [Candidatus Gracilibacteria bacterium]